MAGQKGKSGGARAGTGPIRRRFVLDAEAAQVLRLIAFRELGRKDVSEADLVAILNRLVKAEAYKDLPKEC